MAMVQSWRVYLSEDLQGNNPSAVSWDLPVSFNAMVTLPADFQQNQSTVLNVAGLTDNGELTLRKPILLWPLAVEKTLQNADKAASLLALQANETLPGSLMELSQANELQLQGFFNGMISLLTSILARVLYLATGGAFSLVVCLLSFGMLTDDSGIGVHKELTLSQQLIWPLTCPVMVLRYAAGFGSNPDDRDVFYDVLGDDSLSWVGVIDAFQS
eukprot:g27615.t1